MKEQFIVNRQGKDFCLYAGLIDQAHQEGLKRITTRVEQLPTKDNGMLAVCWAEVETDKGVFCGIGDASPENVGRMIAPHIVRMAETRAKARALRDAINVGMTALEETVDPGGDDGGQQRPQAAQQRQAAPAPKPPVPIRPEAAPEPDGDFPTPPQMERLVKLLRACGKPDDLPQDLTGTRAAEWIRELVTEFNAKSRRKG